FSAPPRRPPPPPPMPRGTPEPTWSTIAHRRLGLPGATAIPIFPTKSSFGSPPASCFQVSPPSVDLYSPLPGKFEGAYTDHGGRRVAHSDAYTTRGFFGSMATSMAPTLVGSLVLKRTFFQVAPPSVDRYRPRSGLAPYTWPRAATNRR